MFPDAGNTWFVHLAETIGCLLGLRGGARFSGVDVLLGGVDHTHLSLEETCTRTSQAGRRIRITDQRARDESP